MRTKNLFISVLLSGFILSLFLSPDLTALKKNQGQQPQKTKPIVIPKQVKVVFEEGMKTQEPRLDIPFAVAEYIYLPSLSQNLYTIFLFKEMSSPETTVTVHKGFFTYSILQFEPNLEGAHSSGDTMEVFFYIYGAQPVEGQNFVSAAISTRE